ncbi:MAG: Diguanylate cyclase protein [Pseudonocardiales bacterium]|nr:Diguanylate cyclase protein [Pseudonocardiales bacterium]
MRRFAHRATAGLTYACVFFAVAVVAVSLIGIIGVRSVARTGNHIASDELATATATSQVSRGMDLVYSTGTSFLLSADPGARAAMAARLYDHAIPAVDAELATVQRLHEGDGSAERDDLVLLANQWTQVRSLLNPLGAGFTVAPNPGLAAQLSSTFSVVSDHLDLLVLREQTDASEGQAQSSNVRDRTTWIIIAAAILALLATVGLWRDGIRRIRRAVEPAQDQVQFADTLQLAENEDEAHRLLQRHLQRTVPDGTVTVLNRNNSADRLEAVTVLPPGSPLTQSLQHAAPRSCLAVRSGRSHDEDNHDDALLGCAVCGKCPGRSTCTPLTVGGEVIGSVLITRQARYSAVEQQVIRDSVGQAAPVLANLRNLAIAELRAATDSLTGLPNKRAVGDTLKRMLGQASRTLTPLSLLLLDLDHFKEINDRYGHPVGDQVLANVGAALRSALRDSDFAGRNGGEEFAVVLPDTDIAGAALTAEKIRAAIADISLPGTDLSVTASVGLAAYPDHATNTERLERLADSALYTAKRSGRNRVEIATPPPTEANTEQLLHQPPGLVADPSLVPTNGHSHNR